MEDEYNQMYDVYTKSELQEANYDPETIKTIRQLEKESTIDAHASNAINVREIKKMETTETKETENKEASKDIEIGIGTKEVTSLKPAEVVIISVEIESVGTNNAKKLICSCKHPDKQENINISSVKWENTKKGKLEVAGLWVNKDEDGLLRKGSALAVFITANGATKPSELVGKKLSTILDENGYLAFKNY